MQPSVDAFIENRPEFMKIGKAAIVGTLIPNEQEGSLLARGEQMLWYEYLFNKMAENRNDYEQSHLSVVTLNYDRSFEHFLFHALRSSFHLADAECLELLNRTPIVHVYGQMGALDYASHTGRAYHPNVDSEIVRRFAPEIKIGHEDVGESEALKRARDLISRAEVVCFLGFGYHPRNIERLGIAGVAEDTLIYGSTYRMTEVEVAGIYRIVTKGRVDFSRILLWDALDYLRNNPVLD
jgi:hypothetical protein